MLCCLKKLISEHLLTSSAQNFLFIFFAFRRLYLKRYPRKVSTSIGHVNRPHWEVGNADDHFQLVTLTVLWDLVVHLVCRTYDPTFHLTRSACLNFYQVANCSSPISYWVWKHDVTDDGGVSIPGCCLLSSSIASRQLLPRSEEDRLMRQSVPPRQLLVMLIVACYLLVTSFVWWVMANFNIHLQDN